MSERPNRYAVLSAYVHKTVTTPLFENLRNLLSIEFNRIQRFLKNLPGLRKTASKDGSVVKSTFLFGGKRGKLGEDSSGAESGSNGTRFRNDRIRQAGHANDLQLYCEGFLKT